MEPQEFLAAVLPLAGIYCVCELSTSQKEHVFAPSLQELQPHIQRFNEAKLNTYFALASFKKAGSRVADNAQSMRALFFDLDCGTSKKAAYPTKTAAVEALSAFVAKTGLPDPWLISSGNGVHAYWPFDRDAEIPEWKLAAENLKRLAKQEELGIDFTVTADAARVLRMPGTSNWKDPKNPKKCLIKSVPEKTQYPFAELVATITAQLKNPIDENSSLFNVPGERLPPPTTPSLVKVLENRITFFKAILDRTAAGTGCGQLAHYLGHAKDDGMEPLWRGLLSLAKVCSDNEKASHYLSKLHPYEPSRMQQKLKEIKGPYPCVKFDSENPGICTQCSYWGKITNPLTFGHEVAVDNAEKQLLLPPMEATEERVSVTRPVPPSGFSYGAKGGVYRQVKEEDAEGALVVMNKLILSYDVFVTDLLKDEEGHHVNIMAMRPEGATSIVIPQRAVVSKDDTVKALAEKNVLAAYGSGNDKYLFDYIRACAELVSSSRKAIEVPVSYGWQPDNTFVLNSAVFSAKGEKFIPIPKLANINSITTPAGTLEKWRDVWQMVISKKYYDILAMAAIGFGSPLMKFTGFEALTYHIGSSESGTGKSLALTMARSVWGSKQYIMNPKASEVMQEHRAGALGNLPLIIDEITEANDNFDWLAAFIMNMTAGGGKERMFSSVNQERINNTHWCAIGLLASNKHAVDYFSAVRKKESRGHLRRLLEIKMEEVISWTSEEEERIQLLGEHYGYAGRKYAQWLAKNAATAQRITKQVYREFKQKVNGVGDERFWVAGCAANLAGCILAGKEYADVINLPVPHIEKIYQQMITDARGNVKANVRSAEDILNSYTREFFGQFVVIRINNGAMESSYGGTAVDKSITRSKICGRVEHDVVPGHIRYYIEEQQIRKFCSDINYGYSDFKRQLEKEFVVCYVKKDMLSKTQGPQMRVNAIQVTRPETDLVKELEAEAKLAVENAEAG